MVAKLPLLEGDTDVATFMAWGFDPYLSEKSPFHGAVYAVTESVCKAVAAGARLSDIRLTLQEYFPKLGTNPSRWGLPFAALLGAFHAQHSLRLAAIGGKDSMSGSFNDLDVPPTLVSFALAPGKASLALSPEFKKPGSTISLVEVPRDADNLPDFEALKQTAEALHQLNAAGKLLSLHHIGAPASPPPSPKWPSATASASKGARASRPISFHRTLLHLPHRTHRRHSPLPSTPKSLGTTTAEPTLILNGESHSLTDLQAAWESTLEPVYPTQPEDRGSSIEDTWDLRRSSLHPQSTIHNPQSQNRRF